MATKLRAEVLNGKVVYHKVKSKTAKPKAKTTYTPECRARYKAYARKAAKKGITVIDITKWAPINFPQGIVKHK